MSADARRAGGKHVEQCRDEGRIVLAVAVERDDDLGARMRHAGAHGRRLSAGRPHA